MSNVLTTTYAELSDEELLLRGRMGGLLAYDVLAARKAAMRHPLCHHASPKMKVFFDDWEINEIFFHAFFDAQLTYEFGKSSFQNFLIRCIRFVMSNRVDHKLTKKATMVTNSLEEALSAKDGSSLTLSDVVASDGPLDDPKDYMNFQDSIMEVSNLPKNIDPIAIAIMRHRLEGYTVQEAAARLSIPHKKAIYVFSRYGKWVKRQLSLEEEAKS